jgi:asparagine synthase (glutamine-hydrolysing)
MCGIFGLVGKRSPEVKRALHLGTRALAHRGPDDEGIEILPLPSDAQQCVGLGSRRLAILDLSPAGHQPMYDPATGNWLIFNGEIYNFQETRLELQKLGHPFASTGDTEVLLKAYGQWGEACLERLVGMFAFAVWDSHNERLFLARDRLGEKPLYYYAKAGLFIFASEIRSLLATGLAPRRLDTAGLASYLAFGAVQDPLTIMVDVRSLPPGHTLTWERGQCCTQRYWSLAEVASRPPATGSLEEAVKGIRRHLLEAVSQRLVSDVPLGIFLSGGVDSSSVVALAREVRVGPPDTFSVVFGHSEFCEAAYSNRLALEFGCRHHQIDLSEDKLLEEIPDVLGSMDQPTIDGVNTYVVSQATKKAGITVALSGLGGDELFAGYSSFVSVPRMLQFRRYAGWLEPLGKGVNALLERSQTNRPAKMRALAAGDYYAGQPYFLSRALFLPASVRALLPSLTFQDGNLAAAWNLQGVAEAIRGLDPVNQVAVLESSTYMANMLLRDTDCMSMAHALEVRTPLLHHPLWEYVLPLASRLKCDAHLPKPLLLRAAGQRLPEEIYLRRKMGFTLPFELWMRNGLKAELERELLDPGLNEYAPLDAHQVANIWKAFLAGKTNWSRPWGLFVLKRWIRQNIVDWRWSIDNRNAKSEIRKSPIVD